MRRILPFFFLFFCLQTQAAPGDTTLVVSHDSVHIETGGGYTDYPSWVVFPQTDMHKVVLNLTFRCPYGENCGEWDYLNYIYLKRRGMQDTVPLNIELARYITPYGNSYNQAWKGEWKIDVTDFAPLLKDSLEIVYRHTGYETNVGRGWNINMWFEMIEGTPARPFVKLNKLWNGQYSYGFPDNPINTQLGSREITLSENTQSIRSYIVQTGHSFGDPENCAEFCPKQRTLKMDGSTYLQKFVWRDECGENPNFPQAGTWIYDRSGWCPGDMVYPDFADLTVEPSTTHTFTCEMQNYVNQGGSSPNYVIESFLFEYGAPNFVNDASVEQILAPSTDYYHARFNPICGTPKIVIRNNGSAPLTSAQITYGDAASWQSTFNWTGNLGFLKSEEVLLPAGVAWNTNGTFRASVALPNGQADEYEQNNTAYSEYESPLSLPDSFVVNVRTNNVGSEYEWSIVDDQGNTVASRSGMANATEYKDTVRLGFGCYTFRLNDAGEDGLSWWANTAAGSGFARLRRADASGFLKTFGADFGSFLQEDFTVGGVLSAPVQAESIQRAKIYPNPACEQAFLQVLLNRPEDIRVTTISIDGKLVDDRVYRNTDTLYENILRSDFKAGVYFTTVEAGLYRQNIRWVVTP
jgi:hypothetical protein